MAGGLLAVLGGKPPSDKASDKGAPPESSGSDPGLMAAEDALAAFESGDASALNEALKRHYDACKAAELDDDMDEGYE